MKTQRFLLLSMCYLFVTSAFATPSALDQVLVRVEQKEAGRINLQLANLQGLSTEIKLLDLDGKLWFSKMIQEKNGYVKQYDVRSLPAGTYFISVESEKIIHQQLFKKTGEHLIFFQKTVQNAQNNLVRLVNRSENEPKGDFGAVKVTFIDKQKVKMEVDVMFSLKGTIQLKSLGGTKIVELEASGKDQYIKIFNLEGLTPGDYYFLIENGATQVVQFLSFSKRHGIQINTQQQLVN